MRTLILTKNNFIEYPINIQELKIENIVNLGDYEKYKSSMQILIDYFNSEFKWDGMFTLNDIRNRIIDGHELNILFYNTKEIGYVWTKRIDNQTCFAYNLYVTKIIERPKESPICLLSFVYNNCLKVYKKIEMEIEDWNIAAYRVVLSLTDYFETPNHFD